MRKRHHHTISHLERDSHHVNQNSVKLPSHHINSSKTVHLSNDKSAFSSSSPIKKSATKLPSPTKVGSPTTSKTANRLMLLGNYRKRQEKYRNRNKVIKVDFLDKEEARQKGEDESNEEEEKPEDAVDKPRKIIFDRNCTEYFELMKMITKDTRNKFSSRSFAPKPKMPYRPNIWLKLNLQRIKANMTKEEGLAKTEAMLKNLEKRRKKLNDFYNYISQPVYKTQPDITLREAFRIGIETKPWEVTTTEYFETIAPYHMVEIEHFRCILCQYFDMDTFDSHRVLSQLFKAFAYHSPKNEQGAPTPDRVDYRVIICSLKALQDPAPEYVRSNLEFFLQVYLYDIEKQLIKVDDFVSIMKTCALTIEDLALGDAIKETMERKWEEKLFQYLPEMVTINDIMGFVDENDYIIKNLSEQQMKCLSISHRTRVIVDLTTSCERRKDHIIETMRRKKAMYFWRFRTTDKFLHRWKDHTVRLMEIRENCEVGEGYFYKKKATLYVKRWLIFTHRKEILKMQLERGKKWFERLTKKHIWRRWILWTGISKKLYEYERMKKRQEYIHACKGLVRTFHKIILKRSKGGIIHAFFRWSVVSKENEEFEQAVQWYKRYLMRSQLSRWVAFVNDIMKLRQIENIRIQEQQQHLMAMKEEGIRLLEEQKKADEAERARLLALENAEIDRRIEEEDRVKAQRRKAEKRADTNLILRMQAETRKQHKDAVEAKKRLAFDRKWDAMEAAMATKAKIRASEYIDSYEGQGRLKKEVLEVIEAVSSNIQTKEEREELMGAVPPAGRFGRVRWWVRYDRKTASKYYYNVETNEREIPDALVQMNKKARLKCERVATENYIDEEMINAREKAAELRKKGWHKEVRAEAAKVIHRFWTRVRCWKELESQKWVVEIRAKKHKAELENPAATLIQKSWRGRFQRKKFFKLGLELIERFVTDNGKVPYYYNHVNGQSVWDVPYVYVAKERDDVVQAKIMKKHYRLKNERRDRIRAEMKKEKEEERKAELRAQGYYVPEDDD